MSEIKRITFEYIDKGNNKSITFEEGQTYYIADWFPTQSKGQEYYWPILIETKCVKVDPVEWDTEFQLKGIKNLFRSDFYTQQSHHPEGIHSVHWDHYFFDSIKEAFDRFYAEYKEDRKKFFDQIFRSTR